MTNCYFQHCKTIVKTNGISPWLKQGVILYFTAWSNCTRLQNNWNCSLSSVVIWVRVHSSSECIFVWVENLNTKILCRTRKRCRVLICEQFYFVLCANECKNRRHTKKTHIKYISLQRTQDQEGNCRKALFPFFTSAINYVTKTLNMDKKYFQMTNRLVMRVKIDI